MSESVEPLGERGHSAVVVLPRPGHLTSAVEGGTAGLRAIVLVDLPDAGLYTISAFGLAGGGLTWTADGCLKSVLCPPKDPRAPQNLYPIAGLERELRRRLGDPALLYRSLRAAAVA